MPLGIDVTDMETAAELLEMDVTPLDRIVVCGEDHNVTVQIFREGILEAIPIAKQEVNFMIVEGPNAGIIATVATDNLGQANFIYHGSGGAGTDRITVGTRLPKSGETMVKTITVTWMNTAPILEVRDEPMFVDQDNHKYITITPDMVIERAEDVFGNSVNLDAVSVVSVSSDEPEDHIGDGSTVDDILIECPNKVMLRTERMGGEEGRVYTIHYLITDANGRTAADELKVVIVKGNSDPNAVLYHRYGGYTVTPGCGHKDMENPF
jgi:hypothetical protein